MKAYKHKITGKIAFLSENIKNATRMYIVGPEQLQIPAWLVENTNDWSLFKSNVTLEFSRYKNENERIIITFPADMTYATTSAPFSFRLTDMHSGSWDAIF